MSAPVFATLGWAAFGLSVIGWVHFLPTPTQIVYNASASVPRGWYLITGRAAFQVGDVVLARLPARVASWADERQYLPLAVPIMKRVGAVAGQRVCVRGGAVAIDQQPPIGLLARDGRDRPLTPWPHCRALQAGEVFLLSPDSRASFDSRYFGPIPEQSIIGRAVALWTW